MSSSPGRRHLEYAAGSTRDRGLRRAAYRCGIAATTRADRRSPTVARVTSGAGPSGEPSGGHGWRGDYGWQGGRRGWRGPRLFLPVVVGAIQVIGSTLAAQGQPDAAALNGLGYALLLAGPAALLLRRRWPLSALAISLAATVAYLVVDFPRGPFFLAAVIALFAGVRRAPRVAVWTMCAAAYVLFVAITASGQLTVGGVALANPSLGEYLVVAAWTAVAVALAEAARVRSEQFAVMARTRAEAARARQEQSRRQASDERLRIARELHDVLGHHLSLINVRAGVALHLLDSRPEQAREALGAIKLASAEALREVRGVLAALHPQDESAPRFPAPGLADLDHLSDEAKAAGLKVTLRRDGAAQPVPAEVDRAAYRIVQEALTNVRRHAGPDAVVTIIIGYGRGALAVRVDDTGAGPPLSTSDTPGNGIPGMRERAAALGGTLTAGARPGGGFRVDANLPHGRAEGTIGEMS